MIKASLFVLWMGLAIYFVATGHAFWAMVFGWFAGERWDDGWRNGWRL